MVIVVGVVALVVIIVVSVVVDAAAISAVASSSPMPPLQQSRHAPSSLRLPAMEPVDSRCQAPTAMPTLSWSTCSHTGHGIPPPPLPFPMLSNFPRTAEKSKAGSFPCLIQTGEGSAFDFFCAFRSTYDYFSQSTAIRMGTFRFLGGYQLFGESVSSETSASALNARRNARESCRKPRKPQETFRKPPETASETVRFRGSFKRSLHFGPYPGINLYY